MHLIVGVLVSAGLHLSLVAFSGNPPARVAAMAEPRAVAVEVAPMDFLEPEPVPVESAEVEPVENLPPSFAPPSQAELPSMVAVDAFVQMMQAPTPASANLGDSLAILPRSFATGQAVAQTTLFDIKELDRVPRRIRSVLPDYPAELKRARVEGEVVLLVAIDQTGGVRVERVIESTAREFAVAAVTAAEKCQFETPMRAGAPVSASYTMRVPFRLSVTLAAH